MTEMAEAQEENLDENCVNEGGEEAVLPGKRISPIKAIRLKCVDCCGGSRHEVSLCETDGCPLHPFRFGRNPFVAKRVMSAAQRVKMAERLRLWRFAKQVKEAGD